MKKHILVLFLFSAISVLSIAQPFEGVMDFNKISVVDTIKYRYYVKGNNVRIEEMNKKGVIAGIMLVDLAKGSILALSPDRKMYMEVPALSKPAVTGKVEVNKTAGKKIINGYTCKLWRMRNKAENTEVSYWVAEDKFDFFNSLLKVLNRKDKLSVCFMQAPTVVGAMALEATERNLLRDFKNAIVTTKIEKKVLDASLFSIPAEYKKYDK
jgi:hypothetical protein